MSEARFEPPLTPLQAAEALGTARRPARRAAFRQCDVVRALKAAKAAGAGSVIVRRDGSLEIELERRRVDEAIGGRGLPAGEDGGEDREIVL